MLRTLPLILLLAALVALAGCSRSGADADVADTGAATPAATATPSTGASAVDPDLPTVTMYKSPSCGCCGLWADHMEENGFRVERVDVPVLYETKQRLGVPAQLGSCHTAVVDGYVVEGHVPAEDVKRMLRDRPEAAGIAVPGMPIGSPGMEVPDREPQAYDVMLFERDGRVALFSRH